MCNPVFCPQTRLAVFPLRYNLFKNILGFYILGFVKQQKVIFRLNAPQGFQKAATQKVKVMQGVVWIKFDTSIFPFFQMFCKITFSTTHNQQYIFLKNFLHKCFVSGKVSTEKVKVIQEVAERIRKEHFLFFSNISQNYIQLD